jgi:hypothetical protein
MSSHFFSCWMERGKGRRVNPVEWKVSPDSLLNSDHILTATMAMWGAPKGVLPYIRQHFLDTTFRGLYHVNGFDLAMLIPYFIVLILLAGYGMHRYVLVYLYYKHRQNRTTEPASRFEELPRVTVQLPIFNEQYVVERLLEAVCKLSYPREKLDIQLLDDSTPWTWRAGLWSATRRWAVQSPTITARIGKDSRRARWPRG